MKIILAADGSKFTDRAIEFLVAHEPLVRSGGEVIVVHVQTEMPLRMQAMFGAAEAQAYYSEESDKVLQPVALFLERHQVRHRCIAAVGPVALRILETAHQERADLVVMGTHGHGLLGRIVLGSVAQRVLSASDLPVLMVK